MNKQQVAISIVVNVQCSENVSFRKNRVTIAMNNNSKDEHSEKMPTKSTPAHAFVSFSSDNIMNSYPPVVNALITVTAVKNIA